MIWVVQNALFGDEFGYHSFIAAIDASGQKRIHLDYAFWESTIDLKLTGQDPTKVFPFGTKNFTYYGLKNDWLISWDINYEYTTLFILGDDFINHDMKVDKITDLNVPKEGKVFIRENHGFNIFKGKVISGYAWPDWVEGFSNASPADMQLHDWHPIDGNSIFCWAPVKNILDEYRCWVIGNRVVSSSQYVNKGEIKYTNSDENYEVNSYAQKMVNKIRPFIVMDNFVIDIFLTNEGLKVGELNCIHCSGWYAINSKKVIDALVEHYD